MVGSFLIFIVWPTVEFWLGRTNKVKAGSVLEILYNAVKYLIGRPRQKLITGHIQGEETMADLNKALEGVEFEQKVGKLLSIEVDVTPALDVKFSGVLKAGLGIDQYAAKASTSKWVRGAINMIYGFIDREPVSATPAAPSAPAETAPQSFAVAQTDLAEENTTEPKQGPTA